jgi:hypothetical protein
MAGGKFKSTEAKHRKWIKEGRGSGRNESYKPWLTVRDVASRGRSHRVYGHKSKRTHHLLSDLELGVFLALEWNHEITEIREQFPLNQEVTVRLSEEAGIVHPAVSGHKQVMSSDFLVDTLDLKRPQFALQAKYASDLSDRRTIEKLEIERRYWSEKEIPWYLITEQDINKSITSNISWLYAKQRDEISIEVLIKQAEKYLHHFQSQPKVTLIQIAKDLDAELDLPLGESLGEIRQLLAHRCFNFNIYKPIKKLIASDLELTESFTIGRSRNVS